MFVDVAGRFKMRSRTGGLLDLAFATFIPALFKPAAHSSQRFSFSFRVQAHSSSFEHLGLRFQCSALRV